jgi:hypothetical protein
MSDKKERTKRPLTAFVWPYFTLNGAGDTVSCTECSYTAKYTGTTSGMTNHLKHHDITKESEAKRLKSSEKSASQNVDSLDTNEGEEENSSHAKDCDTELVALYKAHPKNQKLAQNMVNWMADANISLNAFMKPSFTKLVKDLNPNVKAACRQTFSQSILPNAVFIDFVF